MRITTLILIVASFSAKAQVTEKLQKNYFNYQLGNSTPVMGITYMRGFGYSKPDNLRKHHFEFGAGLGVQPFNMNYPADDGSPLVLSHNFCYVNGIGKTFWTIGYNGIYNGSDNIFGNIGVYNPNPYLGFRLEYSKMVWNINYNGYLFKDKTLVIKDNDQLFERISTKILTAPGVSVGWKF
jgi:hypothetical protein